MAVTALPLGALLLGGSWIWGYAVALRWVPGWSTGERLAAATVVGFATLQAAFGALILLGWFTRTSVVVLSGSLLVAAGSGGVGAGRLGAAARADAAAARRALGGASVVAKAVGVGVVALGVAMVARSLVVPHWPGTTSPTTSRRRARGRAPDPGCCGWQRLRSAERALRGGARRLTYRGARELRAVG